ncbi:ABC transporter ATP-binding protein [Peribacillus butanolivorans]|uniref:ABC transporter ATP-binding protein n=1 Tax=Peribacillus butanolivorans TaxID=421767 RepID=UPI0006A731B4|nr:ABC transporter ATP-binding protein [Peribacillus butanolivorans]KON69285.1 ABC transporter ATP-binding protein [Peribacillus butanolivorans]
MILSVNNIHKSYGKEEVLKGISFDINNSEIVALVGPNGSGKSTLLNIINNLLPANNGKVNILGGSNKDPEVFRKISFMQDNTVLYDYLTGYDHLQFIGDLQRITKKHIFETAERIGIDGYLNKKVGHYSLGMKQHLLLAMALINQPKLLILDEPLNGLDPTSAIKVRELLLELAEQGTAILLSSHNLAEIDKVTSNILFLKNGVLIHEDLSAHKQVWYEIKVMDVEMAEFILSEANITTKFEGNRLYICLKDENLQNIFELLKLHNIVVLDIEKKILGTEERYKKIFFSSGGVS